MESITRAVSLSKRISMQLNPCRRALTRGAILRANGNHLPPAEFKARSDLLIEKYEDGSFLKEPVFSNGDAATPPNPLDPSAMEG
jgi:hypothetical protein